MINHSTFTEQIDALTSAVIEAIWSNDEFAAQQWGVHVDLLLDEMRQFLRTEAERIIAEKNIHASHHRLFNVVHEMYVLHRFPSAWRPSQTMIFGWVPRDECFYVIPASGNEDLRNVPPESVEFYPAGTISDIKKIQQLLQQVG